MRTFILYKSAAEVKRLHAKDLSSALSECASEMPDPKTDADDTMAYQWFTNETSSYAYELVDESVANMYE